MLSKIILASVALVILSGPAFSAEYYVAQNASDKKCSVTETKPDGTTMIMIGTAAYATQEEADAAMKAAAECK